MAGAALSNTAAVATPSASFFIINSPLCIALFVHRGKRFAPSAVPCRHHMSVTRACGSSRKMFGTICGQSESLGRDRDVLRRQRLGRLAVPPAAIEPNLQAIEIKIDHRRGEQREQLTDDEAADHRVTERLAQLRTRTGAEH